MFIRTLEPLTNYDITHLAKELKIKNQRGIYEGCSSSSPWDKECGVVSLDLSKNSGTYWVCYYKNKEKSYYFDSFGLDSPIELRNYLNSQIKLSTFQIQKFNTHYYGYYCLLFLKLLEKYDFFL